MSGVRWGSGLSTSRAEGVQSELSSLKQQPGKDLLVLGSSVLTASLIAEDYRVHDDSQLIRSSEPQGNA